MNGFKAHMLLCKREAVIFIRKATYLDELEATSTVKFYYELLKLASTKHLLSDPNISIVPSFQPLWYL